MALQVERQFRAQWRQPLQMLATQMALLTPFPSLAASANSLRRKALKEVLEAGGGGNWPTVATFPIFPCTGEDQFPHLTAFKSFLAPIASSPQRTFHRQIFPHTPILIS
ncbi:UNVERIFIED_CONTAM: hypothetical protein K2H54_049366 [Gekko kuhli]